MTKALTAKAIEAAKAGASRVEVADGLLAGLYLVVQPSGAKSWAVRYRAGGKPRKLTLGAWPAIELGEARDLAREALVAVARGKDPAQEKQVARAAAADADRETRDRVETIIAAFVERYVKPNTKASSARETERILKREIESRWKGRRIQDIGRRDVIDVLDDVVDKGAPILANRVLAAVRKMTNWCVERGIIDVSPCERVKAPAAERSRDRVLSDDELRLVWKACGGIGWPFGPMTRLLVLTGQRREEVAGMTWSEIDLDRRLWTIPKERTKNGVVHEVPLSAAAVAVLEYLPRIAGKPGFVFTTTGRTPVSGFSKGKSRLDDLMTAALREAAGNDNAPLPGWRLHDLRRTAASGMARLGIALPVIEKVLNHTSGSFGGIVGVYQRHSFADEKRAALEIWGRFIEALVADKPASNVVEMRMSADA